MNRHPRSAPPEGRVEIDGITVDDLTFEDTVARLEHAVRNGQKFVAFALHVGGLLHLRDQAFIEAFNHAQCRYADGIAAVLLARLAGARRVERTPTTDLAPALFQRFAGRAPLRIALIGGADGLARRAGEALERQFNVEVVQVEHGFHAEWTDVLCRVSAARPQVIMVGMGMPREAKWVRQHLAALPDSVIVTCGGWFGFVAGDERRAPAYLRVSGFEWVARLAQDPTRLAGRYALGAVATGTLAARLTLRRWR